MTNNCLIGHSEQLLWANFKGFFSKSFTSKDITRSLTLTTIDKDFQRSIVQKRDIKTNQVVLVSGCLIHARIRDRRGFFRNILVVCWYILLLLIT